MLTCWVMNPRSMGRAQAPAAKKGMRANTAGPEETVPSPPRAAACSSKQPWMALRTPTNGLSAQIKTIIMNEIERGTV